MESKKPNPIAAARHRKGLTQRQLADLIGASRGQIANWETEAATPPPACAIRLAKALRMSLDQIYANVETQQKVA